MTNKTDFYKIIETIKKDKGWQLRFVLYPEHPIFKGHFPEQPVLPGVCMVLIVKNAVRELTGENWFLSEARQVKFLEMIIPHQDEVYDFHLEIEEKESYCGVQASFDKKGKPFFKFQGKFILQPDGK